MVDCLGFDNSACITIVRWYPRAVQDGATLTRHAPVRAFRVRRRTRSPAPNPVGSSDSVSYTHLDVYKRQPMTSSVNACLKSFRSSRGGLCISRQPNRSNKSTPKTNAIRRCLLTTTVKQESSRKQCPTRCKRVRWHCEKAVSYTHLDVYKRQPLALAIRQPLY